ncbi:hypothetical protein QQP08_013342 [Theobroma cacao]|nr:hypothetical protein QQP08_013342 [Theobroma cacao]
MRKTVVVHMKVMFIVQCVANANKAICFLMSFQGTRGILMRAIFDGEVVVYIAYPLWQFI